MTTKKPVHTYRVHYTYTNQVTGMTWHNSAMIAAYNLPEARAAFYAVYKTESGQHQITGTEVLSTVDLDTLF